MNQILLLIFIAVSSVFSWVMWSRIGRQEYELKRQKEKHKIEIERMENLIYILEDFVVKIQKDRLGSK